MIKYCGKRKETEDCIWSVFTSFGYLEVDNNKEFKESNESGKFCYFENGKSVAEKKGNINKIDKAELVALCVEASIANGLEDFIIEVEEKEVFEILELFGFEKMIKLNAEVKGFKAISNGICYSFQEDNKCVLDTFEFMKALEASGIDLSDTTVDASLIFAEENAEGLAYDVAYNLRVNGCIIEYYSESNDIEKACLYAQEKGMSCVLRAYPDGTLKIKDMIKNEITETSVSEFLGYYEEEDECDCGHDHHDGCSCGHNHDHHDGCNCGHDHHHQ